MVGARVNGKLVPIDYVIQNGDRIEIITSQNSKGPSRDWLKIVKSTQAKNKINQWFKSELKEDNIIQGKELIDQLLQGQGHQLVRASASRSIMEKVMTRYAFRDWDSVLAAVGHGGLKEGQVVNRMLDEYQRDHKKKITDAKVLEAAGEPTRTKRSFTLSNLRAASWCGASTTWRCIFPNAAARCPGTRSWAS